MVAFHLRPQLLSVCVFEPVTPFRMQAPHIPRPLPTRPQSVMPTLQYLTTTILFDFGAIAALPAQLSRLGIARPLMVSDPGLSDAPPMHRVAEVLGALPEARFDQAPPDPNEDAVMAAAQVYREHGCDGVVAVGGGAVMDLSKSISLMSTHDGSLEQYSVHRNGMEAITSNAAPLVTVPTTAGTGAEIGPGGGIELRSTPVKTAVRSPHLAPRVAVCDPELTMSLPPRLTAGTGIDALTHCVEAFVSRIQNPPASAIALDGMKRAWAFVERATHDGSDRQARWNVMMAGVEGGMAAAMGVGGAHAMSLALDRFGLHHGTVVGLMLPHVLRLLHDDIAQHVPVLRDAIGLPTGADLPDALQAMNRRIGLPAGLREMGVPDDALDDLAEASTQAFFNRTSPRTISSDEYRSMLAAAMA